MYGSLDAVWMTEEEKASIELLPGYALGDSWTIHNFWAWAKNINLGWVDENADAKEGKH